MNTNGSGFVVPKSLLFLISRIVFNGDSHITVVMSKPKVGAMTVETQRGTMMVGQGDNKAVSQHLG
jgi:hypothetical protein